MSSDTILNAPVHGSLWKRSVLGYHEFSPALSRDVYQLSPERFAAQIAASQAAAKKASRQLEITFDDGHRSQIEHAAPLLEQFGMRGTFFVPAGWVSARSHSASWDDLKALVRSGHTIGSHGQTHTLLTSCSQAVLAAELSSSRKTLEDRLGCSIRSISAPGGRWNATVARACLAAGYRQLYTSQPGSASVRSSFEQHEPQGQLMIVGRLVVRRRMPLSTVSSYVAGEWLVTTHQRAEYQMKETLKRMLGDAGYQTIWRRLLRSPIERSEDSAAL